ncbi:MAG TPA: sporulation protein, partial [Luteimonas sp.]
MAARRGKKQARRNHGPGSGLPGWAWLVLGAVLAVVAVLWVPGLMDRKEGDGFFRPTPNPDAQPAAASGEEPIAGEGGEAADTGDDVDDSASTGTQYDFYKLLPADEVAMTDAELAATERAEAERRARAAANERAMDDAGAAD